MTAGIRARRLRAFVAHALSHATGAPSHAPVTSLVTKAREKSEDKREVTRDEGGMEVETGGREAAQKGGEWGWRA